MKEYHKIQTVFMRDLENRYKTLLEGQFSLPEFEYLANNEWAFTEKVDGCLHYTQPVLTDIGTIPVGRIVEKRLPVKILSWNVEKQVVEYKDILHYHKEKLVRPFLSVTVKSRGKSNRPKHIICTDNHKFYSNDAWIEAKDLKPGDKVKHLCDFIPNATKQIILGGLLGDSSIYRSSKTSRGFSFSHSIQQSEYFDWKKRLLGNLFNETTQSIGGFAGSKVNRRGYSIVAPFISDLITEYCEVNEEKKITEKWANELQPFGIAIWYMDDGSSDFNNQQRPRARLSTNAFNNCEVDLLCNMLKIKYDIDCDFFDYKGNTIVLTADGSEKLYDIISPYVPACMKYKLPIQYRSMPCVYNESFTYNNSILDVDVISVTNELPMRAKRQNTFQYDLTIRDNSNYFTSSILVHNTNIRVMYNCETNDLTFAGKTDDSQVPSFLFNRLQKMFLPQKEKLAEMFPNGVCLYGEGYGNKIQGGRKYSQEQDFVLFDVRIGDFWLKRPSVEDIAENLGIKVVPIIGSGTLYEMVDLTRKGFDSVWGNFKAEGIVARPVVELFSRNGERIITKIKTRDFKRN